MICGVVCGCICSVGRSDPDTTLVDHLCNREKYNSSSSYTYDVAYVTDKLITFMGNNSYDYYYQHSFGDSTCYGHAACNGRITNGDCFYCLQSACEMIKVMCDWSIGVQFQLKDCRTWYENYQFVESKGLVVCGIFFLSLFLLLGLNGSTR